MNPLANPMVPRMGLLLVAALAAFGLGLFVIRRLRKNLVSEPDSLNYAPLAAEGLPVHAYHAVIQQLKQQKHELTAQQLSGECRKARASDTLSSTILSNLSCGVLFFNTTGLVRQANTAARKLLGFASPVGLAGRRPFSHGDAAPAGPWFRFGGERRAGSGSRSGGEGRGSPSSFKHGGKSGLDHLAFEVKDLEEVYRKMTKKYRRLIEPFQEGRWMLGYAADPDGKWD